MTDRSAKWEIRQCREHHEPQRVECRMWLAVKPFRRVGEYETWEEAYRHSVREEAKATGVDPRVALDREFGWSRGFAYPWSELMEVTG